MITKLVLGLVLVFTPAHDWYTGLVDPETNLSCCGGNDCAAISDEFVTPRPGGYDVQIPKFMGYPVNEFVPNARAKPAKEGGQYHLCLVGGKIRCFFYPAPSY